MCLRYVVLTALLATTFGCSRRNAGSVVGRAEASAGPDKAAPDRSAELAQAKQIRGDDDDETVSQVSGQGAKKWRDSTVYVDGRPVGVLTFGELPIALKPTWLEEKASAEIEPGSHSSGFKMVKVRRYVFTDYLKAVGVEVGEVREIHVYGPKFTDTIVATQADLKKQGKDFLFRFGSEVGGKPIPVVPAHFGNGRSPDKISAVMVYIKKQPPKLVWNVGLELNGKIITDVPYYGEPMRGGIRVYQDDRLAFVIKRPLLRMTDPVGTSPAGAPRYSLWNILKEQEKEQEIDTSKIVEAWVVRHERREEKLSREELEKITFEMAQKGQNQITLVGSGKIAQVIALHSKAVRPDQLPQILPDEEN